MATDSTDWKNFNCNQNQNITRFSAGWRTLSRNFKQIIKIIFWYPPRTGEPCGTAPPLYLWLIHGMEIQKQSSTYLHEPHIKASTIFFTYPRGVGQGTDIVNSLIWKSPQAGEKRIGQHMKNANKYIALHLHQGNQKIVSITTCYPLTTATSAPSGWVNP